MEPLYILTVFEITVGFWSMTRKKYCMTKSNCIQPIHPVLKMVTLPIETLLSL